MAAFDFLYEPDERPKRKHHWNLPKPGFAMEGNKLVGKCPSWLRIEQAQALLRDGEGYSPPDWTADWPKRIYVVIDGIPYRATPTTPGRSYHGFPERPCELRRLPHKLTDRLRKRARQQGRLREFEDWLKP